MDSQHTIIINGNPLAFEDGESILEVARRNHIHIPTLCYLKNTHRIRMCNICVVENADTGHLVLACTTLAHDNVHIRTESHKVFHVRQRVLQIMLSHGNHNCSLCSDEIKGWTGFQTMVQKYDNSSEMCPVWGECELQDLAFRYQASAKKFPEANTKYPMEMVNPFIVRDFSRCIFCCRCVKACNDIQVNNAIEYSHIGHDIKIVTPGDKPLKESDCVFCGECVQVCPVGALVEKDVRYKVRPWETKKVRTTCSYCGVGCQIALHVKDNQVVKVTGVKNAPPNMGSLCVKGRFGFNFINSKDRLTKPLIKENGKFREASWDEALDLVARRLGEIKNTHGPETIGVLTSARITIEDNYIISKFTRGALKTNNIDHCARL